MGLRRNARELALQFLYSLDVGERLDGMAEGDAGAAFALFCGLFGEADAEGGRERASDDGFFRPFALWNWEIERCYRFAGRREDDYCRHLAGNPAVRRYARAVALGVCERARELDGQIAALSHSWRLQRMGAVERNIMRIAAWEMRHGEDVPPQVAINEALEIAKRYGEDDSAPFINGILDALRRRDAGVAASGE